MVTPHAQASRGASIRHRYEGGTQKLLIGGQWLAAASGQTFEVLNPATEEVICHVAAAGAEDVDRAVFAARQAFDCGPWPALKPMGRERLMHRLADLLETHADEFAYLESLDNGKPLAQARTRDVHSAIARIRYMAGWASKIEGRTLAPSVEAPNAEFFAFTLREPVGVVGQIIPWNFPLQMAVGKLAPALAAGCTCILKPAEQTPLTAVRLGELIEEAGFPPGVVNVLTGFGATAGAALVEHRGVDKIAFTGSTAVGKQIGARAMQTLKRVSLELGGKSPVIVGRDADLDAAIKGAANAIFYNQGQVCLAGSRLYADEAIFKPLVEGIVAVGKSLKMGPGLNADTQLGPLVSEKQMTRVLAYIEQGKKDGGQLLSGGKRHGEKGYFVEPTVFTGLTRDSACVREEIFGPVLVASAYKSVDELAAIANDTDFGLAASIWTRDISFAHKLARRIRAGTVWVNCHSQLDATMPFGGFKQSGIGRENGQEGVDLYTERKSVMFKL